MRTQCDLFDDGDTAAVVHGGPDQVLQVYRGEVSGSKSSRRIDSRPVSSCPWLVPSPQYGCQ
jgi:hypothetical protein